MHDDWKALAEFSKPEQIKLRHLLRNARTNGIVADGVAVKFGREWRVNEKDLPAFLRKLTLASLSDAA